MRLLNRNLIYFTISFVIMVPIGTIIHEIGHLLVAEFLNYDTTLHHSSLSWNNEMLDSLKKLYNTNEFQIKNNISFDGDIKYYSDYEKYNKHRIYILSGGILQTIFFGTLAFCLLIYRLKIKKTGFNILNWVLIFISLFWSREVFVLLSGIIKGMITNNTFFYGDEAKLANLLNLRKGSILITLGILSTFICFYLLKLIPKKLKKEFIIGGIIGSFIGFIIWVFVLGPAILP